MSTCCVCVCAVCVCVQVQFNVAEVSEVKFIELPDLMQQLAAEPHNFTNWFREELELLQFFCCSSRAAGEDN